MILKTFPLDFQWPTLEPFLFCVHHHDFYPRGTESFGPEKGLLRGRELGMDFEPGNGFRMYHGREVPGFPVHPHRGFETITIVRKGYVDHSDSAGAAARYGEGDVQWLTAGAGVQHSEMFPLLKQDVPNTLELFQIWLNLPARAKMVSPHFKMFWSPEIPRLSLDGGKARVSLIAGEFAGNRALQPPPDSWAADPAHEVLVLLVKLEDGGSVTIPRARGTVNRMLYFFEGEGLEVGGRAVAACTGLALEGGVDLELRSTQRTVEALVLQARPIGEPVVQHGPFVMNSRGEILKAFQDYERTQFGGWPWPREEMVHGPVIAKFAKYPDGRVEKP